MWLGLAGSEPRGGGREQVVKGLCAALKGQRRFSSLGLAGQETCIF